MASTPEDDTPRNPLTQPTFLASAVVVALIAVLGLVLALSGSDRDASQARPTVTTAEAVASQPPRATEEGGCELDPGDQAIPRKAPDADWELDGKFAVPRAPDTFGPAGVADGLPKCFAKSPTGALFASANIYAALSSSSRRSPERQLVALRQFFASGPSRDEAIEVARAADGATPRVDAADATSGVQVAGFSIVRYEQSSAVVDLALSVQQAATTQFVHIASTLRWEDGDWKLVLSENGQAYDSLQQIPDLAGYTPWSGV